MCNAHMLLVFGRGLAFCILPGLAVVKIVDPIRRCDSACKKTMRMKRIFGFKLGGWPLNAAQTRRRPSAADTRA